MEVAKKFFLKKIEPNKFDSILYYILYIPVVHLGIKKEKDCPFD